MHWSVLMTVIVPNSRARNGGKERGGGGSAYFTLASTAMVLSEYLPRPGIRTPDLTALVPRFYPLGHRVGYINIF